MRQAARRLALVAALMGPVTAGADPACTADAIIVFDGSASMAEAARGVSDVPRILLARQAMQQAMPGIAEHRRLGLVTYGPGSKPGRCDNVELRFAPMTDAANRIIAEVASLEPGGSTPLTDAVFGAADALRFTEQPGVIVLVTDGRETCGGSPCALGAELATQGVDLTVHVIGFQVQPDRKGHPLFRPDNAIYKADCLAEQTGGRVVTTQTTEELVAALRETLTCPVLGGFRDAASKG